MEFGERVERRSFFSSTAEWRTRYFVSTDLEFEVAALPTEGQPADFSGAIGSLQATASVDSRDVNVGDSIKLAVTWSGAGNFEFFDPPDPSRLDAFRGFRLYGSTGEKEVDSRRVTYDLAPLSDDVTEIPALPLTVFDPTLEAYTTVETEPIPIRVRPLAEGSGLSEYEGTSSFERDILDIDARPLAGSAEEERGPGDRWIASAMILVPAFWFAGRTLVRRRRGDPAAPLERRRRAARRRLARDLARTGDAQAALRAFQAFLAARTREPDEAWIGRGPVEWNASRSNGDPRLPDDDVAELARLLQRLEASAYGLGSPDAAPPDPSEVLHLANRIVRAGL